MKTLTPNDLGKKFLVEECQKVSISKFVDVAKKNLKEALLKIELNYQKINIRISTSITSKNGLRYWFECPMCQRRAGIIYVHPITGILGCRKCLNLEYRSRRYKGMIESELLKNNKIV